MLHSDCGKCHEDVVNLDDTGLSNHVITATGEAKLVVEVANNIVSASTDSLYRNNVLAHAKLLKEVQARFFCIIQTFTILCMSAYRTLIGNIMTSKCVKILIGCDFGIFVFKRNSDFC